MADALVHVPQPWPLGTVLIGIRARVTLARRVASLFVVHRASWALLLLLSLLAACNSNDNQALVAITCPAGVDHSGPACHEAGATCTYAGCAPSCPGQCVCGDEGWTCGCVPCPISNR